MRKKELSTIFGHFLLFMMINIAFDLYIYAVIFSLIVMNQNNCLNVAAPEKRQRVPSAYNRFIKYVNKITG